MTDERLEYLKDSHRRGFALTAEEGEILAELDRLRADERAMKCAFADRCQDGDALGNALRLAREEGRLEAMRWQYRDARPLNWDSGGSVWTREGARKPWAKGQLPFGLWSLLEGGEADPHSPGDMRNYEEEKDALADLAQALRRLAREWPAEGTP